MLDVRLADWDWLVLGGGAALGAVALIVVRRAVDRRRLAAAIVLVGDSMAATILAGILDGQRRQGLLVGAGRISGPSVARVANLAEAVAHAAIAPCDIMMTIGPETPDRPIVDVRGRRVAVVSGSAVIEHHQGRIPLGLAATDRWLAAVDGPRPFGTAYPIAKRLVDMLVAATVGLILLPLGLAVAGLLRLERRGAVLAHELRVGLGGRPFRLHRFRSARSDPGVAGHGDWQPGPMPTWTGHLLRRTHLDLLPALWNVLRGDLALIGPRPEHPSVVAARTGELPLYPKRHVVRPGLASWAQTRFRYSDAARDTRLALEYDLYYAKYASSWLDLRVFGRAVWLLARDNAAFLAAAIGSGWTTRVAPALARAVGGRPATAVSIAFPDLDDQTPALQATLVVGAGEAGKLLVRELRKNPGWGFWPVAFVDDDRAKIGTRVAGVPVLGPTAAIPTVVRSEHVDAVVIAMPSAPEVVVGQIAERARAAGTRILTMPHIGELLKGTSRTITLRSVRMTDILGRPVVMPDVDRCRSFIAGRRVLVTGAAGSIGWEVARQVAQLGPSRLLALDVNESGLFDLQQDLAAGPAPVALCPIVASVTNRRRLEAVFAQERPEIVFHAAAYKHVPLMEEHPEEAVFVNTIGTYELTQAAADVGVARFVLVSTDKAVRPSSVMGASKRLAELAVKAVAAERGMSACAVRFGNVLGSRGSVVPVFEKQIAAGGPVTVTDPRMKRYFMTIPEAASLIVQAGAFGDGGVIYMLEMGEEVAIRELAERMIRLKGLRVGQDVEIVYTGLRPGEKLREELALDFEAARATPHPKIRILEEPASVPGRTPAIAPLLERLAEVARTGSPEEIREMLLRKVAALDGPLYDLSISAIALEMVPRAG